MHVDDIFGLIWGTLVLAFYVVAFGCLIFGAGVLALAFLF